MLPLSIGSISIAMVGKSFRASLVPLSGTALLLAASKRFAFCGAVLLPPLTARTNVKRLSAP